VQAEKWDENRVGCRANNCYSDDVKSDYVKTDARGCLGNPLEETDDDE